MSEKKIRITQFHFWNFHKFSQIFKISVFRFWNSKFSKFKILKISKIFYSFFHSICIGKWKFGTEVKFSFKWNFENFAFFLKIWPKCRVWPVLVRIVLDPVGQLNCFWTVGLISKFNSLFSGKALIVSRLMLSLITLI